MRKNEVAQPSLKIVQVPITALKPAPYNPRRWDQSAIDQLTESIKRFGVVDPVICNSAKGRENVVIGGHFRLKIAGDLGYKKMPTIFLNIPDAEKERELNLRLNKNVGAWDFEFLKDFDVATLLDIGFSDEELSHVWDDVLEIEDDNYDTAHELSQIKTTDIRPDDMFSLGRHKLICSDSTNPQTIERLAGTANVNVVNVDLPYNIGLDYNAGLGGKKNYGGRINDRKSEAEYAKFVGQIIHNALLAAKPDCHAFFWCDEKFIGVLQELYRQAGISQKRLCLWLKDNQNPTPQVAFNKVTEFCLYGTRGKPYLSDKVKNLHEVMNKEVGTGNRLIDDVMDLFNIWLVKRLPGTQYEHPTEKPPTLYEKALRRCSKPSDTILDLCAGSGSLMIACEQLGRTAYLSEIEPIFCQLILNRYEKLTGRTPRKIN